VQATSELPSHVNQAGREAGGGAAARRRPASVVSVLLRRCENLLSWHASGRTLDEGLARRCRDAQHGWLNVTAGLVLPCVAPDSVMAAGTPTDVDRDFHDAWDTNTAEVPECRRGRHRVS
jgi:hypothetical protein